MPIKFLGFVAVLTKSRASRATGWAMLNVLMATVVGVITARLLGVSLRGTLAILLSVAGLTVLLGTLGTNVAVRRRLPQRQTSVAQYLQVSGLLFLIYLFLLPGIVFAITVWIDPEFSNLWIFAPFLAYGAAFFWSNQLLDLLNAIGKVPLSAATKAFGTAVCLLAVGTSALLGGSFAAVAWSYVLSVLAQIGLAIFLLRRVLQSSPSLGSRRGLVRDGTMLMGLNLGQVITYRGDTILIGALSTAHGVGLYAVATTPAAVLMLPATALGQTMMHDAASGTLNVRKVLKRVLQLELVLGALALIGWLVADFAIVFVFGADFAEAAGVFRVLLIAQLMLAPFMILSRVVVGYGSTWAASISGVVGSVALIGLGWLWIPEMGVYGGAWASVVAYALMSVVSFLQVVRFRDRLLPTVAS